jgi:hypothetical protein
MYADRFLNETGLLALCKLNQPTAIVGSLYLHRGRAVLVDLNFRQLLK